MQPVTYSAFAAQYQTQTLVLKREAELVQSHIGKQAEEIAAKGQAAVIVQRKRSPAEQPHWQCADLSALDLRLESELTLSRDDFKSAVTRVAQSLVSKGHAGMAGAGTCFKPDDTDRRNIYVTMEVPAGDASK